MRQKTAEHLRPDDLMGFLTKEMRTLREFGREILTEWQQDKGWLLSAALAFYMLFSLAPLLIIMVALAGIAFGYSNAENEIIEQVRTLAGERATRALERIVIDISPKSKSIPAALAGFVALFIGATTFFFQMRHALNEIWKVPTPSGAFVVRFIKGRLVAFALALAAGFLMILSLISNTVLAAAARELQPVVGSWLFFWKILDILFSFSLLAALFALLYKFVPDAAVKWRDVWPAALIASFLFNVAKSIIGLYLGHSGIGSAYGAAGSLVVLLVWIFISIQIFLLGGEFAQVYVRHRGHTIVSR
ncbi:MAG: YihY family inner membrane protein [Chitinivibrionales bacterium]|nr:YihY family inner membrane protein [Chitinivibrionales bacterium]